MSTTYTYPGVYIQELPSPVHTITAVATSITAFVGYAARGIDNRAEQLFSFSDFERLFGGIAADSELSYAVAQFFQNGGSEAYVVRVPRHGASGADVVFDGIEFQALSSGSWANGQLLVDTDVQGVDLTADSLAFNLKITDLADNTTESFPNVTLDSTRKNFLKAVVNDPDNGSQLANVSFPGAIPTTAVTVTGTVGSQVTAQAIGYAVSAAPVAGTAAVTQGSTNVTGTGTTFTSLKAGQFLILGGFGTPYAIGSITDDTHLVLNPAFGGTTNASASAGVAPVTPINGTVAVTAGSTSVVGTGTNFTHFKAGQNFVVSGDGTPYKIAGITDDTHLTPASSFNGATNASVPAGVLGAVAASGDFSLTLTTTKPSTPPTPLPLTIKVFGSGTAIPQTVGGLATQLQQAINSVLSIQMPGASVQCSAAPSGTGQAIRVNALLPEIPDAVLSLGGNAAAVLGLASPGTQNVSHYALGTNHNAWGSQTTSGQGSDGSGLPQTGDIIGDPALFTGIYALEKIDLFNLLSIPDATRALPSDPSAPDPGVDYNAIFGAAIALCDQRRAFLLVDPPPNVNSVTGAVDWKTSQLAVVDPNGAAFFPRLRLPDPANNFQLRTFAPSGVVAGVYAAIDAARGVWKAPAGIEATLKSVQGMTYKLTDPENGVLNPVGLNCFRAFPVYGSVLWGARTLVGADAETSQWKYVPVRRTALFLEESLYRGTKWVVFEPNDEPLWAAIRLNVGAFMQTLFLKGAFQGKTPDQAYFVKCDSETTTQTDIDNGIVNILVGFAPLKPAEFVVIQIEQLTGQG